MLVTITNNKNKANFFPRLFIGNRFSFLLHLSNEEVKKLGWCPDSKVIFIDDSDLSSNYISIYI